MKMLRTFLGCMAIGGAMLFAAAPAHAGKGSIYIDLPGLSIGYSDHYDSYYHGRKHRHKRHHKKYDQYYYDPYYSDRYHDRYYRDKYHKKRYYKDRDYQDRYYQDRHYQDYDYRPSRRSYRRSGPICPQPGFSRYSLRGHSCYRHKDHYHCD